LLCSFGVLEEVAGVEDVEAQRGEEAHAVVRSLDNMALADSLDGGLYSH
jgi:hypothetical protein